MSFLTNTLGPFTYLEIFLGVVFFYIVFMNFRAGLVRALGNLIGMVLAAVLAGQFYDSVAPSLTFMPSPDAAYALGFAIVYFVVIIVVGLIVWFADRLFSFLRFIPGLGMANHIGGGLIGVLKAATFLGTLLFILQRFPVNDQIAQVINGSLLIRYLLLVAKVVIWLLPESIRQLPNVIR